ncbi:hypothetical protein SF23_01730 [Streptomyces sp. MBRL 10]|nr:hypothetical protein SF23_01730 [Streptomyces sp. MBRL 10]
MLAAALAVPVGVHVIGDGGAQNRSGQDAPVDEPQARRLAQSSGKEVEVTAARSANATTWAKPDGTFRKQIFSSAVRADVNGTWKPIDTGLERVEAGTPPRPSMAGSSSVAGPRGRLPVAIALHVP